MGNLKRSKILSLLDQGIVSGGNALLQVLLLRILGLEEYGIYAFIMIFVLGLTALNQSVIVMPFQILYHGDNYKKRTKEINTLQIQVIGLLIIILLVVGIVNYFVEMLPPVVFIGASTYGVTYLMHDFIRKRMYVEENYSQLVIFDLMAMLSILCVVVIGYFYLNDLSVIFFGISLVLFICCLFFFGSFGLRIKNRKVYQLHWDHAKWLCASTITQWFSGNIILSTAGVVLGPWVLGVVRMGQTINGVLGVMFQLMESYFPSKVAGIFNEFGLSQLKKYLWQIGRRSFLITFLLALVIIIFRETIMQLIYAEEGVKYAYILVPFGLLLVVNVLNIVMRFYIRSLNLNRIIFESYILLALVNFFCSQFVVMEWGVMGVCFALVANQFLAFIWFVLRVNMRKWNNGFFVGSNFLKSHTSL